MTLPPESYNPKALNDIQEAVKSAKEILANQGNRDLGGVLLTGAERLQRLQTKIRNMAEQIFNSYNSGSLHNNSEDELINNFLNHFKIEPKHDGSDELVIYYYEDNDGQPSSKLDLRLYLSAGDPFPAMYTEVFTTELSIPAELQISELNCPGSKIQITTLNELPATLTKLDCQDNQLTNLDHLPATLTKLYCQGNQLTSLDHLPAGLTKLDCRRNQLTSLDHLPAGLTWLQCADNDLTSLDNLPDSITKLNCRHNQLTSLDHLPTSLIWLECQGNPLTRLDNPPDSLEWINISG